jgi:arylsulfatase A-like enzyme
LELFPTVAAAAQATIPQGVTLDGHDMLPVLAGKAPSPREAIFWEYRGQKAARVGSWKWIDSDVARGLYDLSRDLSEQQDVTAEHPDVAARIAAQWNAWRAEMEAAEPRGPFRDY